jgi:hypothetical protein
MSVIQPTSFDSSKLSISAAKKLDNGSSQAYLNYDGKKLRVQVPRMPIPMDAGDYQGNKKYKVQISFRDKDSNPKTAAYYDMISGIDEFAIQHAMKNSGPWFKKPGMSHESTVDKFTPSIRISKDKDGNPKPYPPTQPIALKQRNGAFDAELYDNQKRLMEGQSPVDILRRGAEITAILECTGVWITDKGFGLTWKLFQARVDQTAEGLEPGCAILDDDDGDAPVVAKPKAKATPAPAPTPAIVDDEEEDEGQVGATEGGDDEDEEIVAAPPVPVKKPVAAVKKVTKVVKKA